MSRNTRHRCAGFSVHKTDLGFRLVVNDLSGKRVTIRLKRFGVVTARAAHEFRANVSMLLAIRDAADVPDESTMRAVRSLHPRLREFLGRCGLLPEDKADRTLDQCLTDFIDAKRSTYTSSSVKVLQRAQQHLLDHFGTKVLLANISVAAVHRFQTYLSGKRGRIEPTMADATVRKMLGVFSQMCGYAVINGWMRANVVAQAEVDVSVAPNKATSVFVTLRDTERLLGACRTAEERLLVGLGRYGGLRIPSEISHMKWEDLDADLNTMKVHATKTRSTRIVPVFPPLESLLRDMRQSEPESTYVLPTLHNHPNPSVIMRRIIKRSGIQDYPRALHSLRASCITDWVSGHTRIADVAQWAGHTTQVMAQYYLRKQSQTSALDAALAARRAETPHLAGGAEMDIAA